MLLSNTICRLVGHSPHLSQFSPDDLVAERLFSEFCSLFIPQCQSVPLACLNRSPYSLPPLYPQETLAFVCFVICFMPIFLFPFFLSLSSPTTLHSHYLSPAAIAMFFILFIALVHIGANISEWKHYNAIYTEKSKTTKAQIVHPAATGRRHS